MLMQHQPAMMLEKVADQATSCWQSARNATVKSVACGLVDVTCVMPPCANSAARRRSASARQNGTTLVSCLLRQGADYAYTSSASFMELDGHHPHGDRRHHPSARGTRILPSGNVSRRSRFG